MHTFKTYRQWCLVEGASPNLWPQIKSVIYNWLEKSNGHGGKYMRYEATTATSANQGSDSWLMPMEPNHMNILLTSWTLGFSYFVKSIRSSQVVSCSVWLRLPVVALWGSEDQWSTSNVPPVACHLWHKQCLKKGVLNRASNTFDVSQGFTARRWLDWTGLDMTHMTKNTLW